jgi:hypothetical protein
MQNKNGKLLKSFSEITMRTSSHAQTADGLTLSFSNGDNGRSIFLGLTPHRH